MISERMRLTGLMIDRPGVGSSGTVSMRFGGGMSCRDICNLCKRVREFGFFFFALRFLRSIYKVYAFFDYYLTYIFVFFFLGCGMYTFGSFLFFVV